MADKISLEAQSREKVGSNSSKQLRKQGLIPAVVYGHGEDTVSVAVNFHDFTEGLHHGHRLFDMKVDGKPENVLVKDLQYDYLGRDVVHADFVRIDMTEKVTVSVGLNFKGTAEGTAQGGIIETQLDEIEIECMAGSIPESIDVPIKEIQIGDTIHAAEISLPEGTSLVTDPEALVLTCTVVSEAVEEEAEEEMPEGPEVITEKKPEEEESESE